MGETGLNAEGQASIHVLINGEARPLRPGLTIDALISQLGFDKDRVAVEYNRAIVRRPQWPQLALSEGDRLEIVHFVGGG